MNISELTFTVDQHGSVKLPAPVLKEMGLYPGDHVRVAYLTSDGVSNTFREFMLLPDPVDKTDSEKERLFLPTLLMEQAGPDCAGGALPWRERSLWNSGGI